jgi:hypothetical protein
MQEQGATEHCHRERDGSQHLLLGIHDGRERSQACWSVGLSVGLSLDDGARSRTKGK